MLPSFNKTNPAFWVVIPTALSLAYLLFCMHAGSGHSANWGWLVVSAVDLGTLGIAPEAASLTDVIAFPIANWDWSSSAVEQQQAILALESGNVLLFPQLHFPLQNGEDRLLSPNAAGQAKNVSLDPVTGAIRGSNAEQAEMELLKGMMGRYAAFSRGLVRNLLPSYEAHLQQARTSYRPIEIAGRTTSWRKDDTRLHVDSFPATPTQGKRILRVFTNVNPDGKNRTWRLGEPFENVVQRFTPSIPKPVPGASATLRLLGLTKSRRSEYDHYMLHMHDRMKADLAYQTQAPQQTYEFPPGSTWIVYTDQVSHAAMQGQYALEQTFHLPVNGMHDPSQSPLRVLERRLGRPLA